MSEPPEVPVVVSVRNEAAALAPCLRALTAATRYAAAQLPLRYRVRVVLDRCTDASERIARGFAGVEVLRSARPGKLEAQRAGVRAHAGPAPFYLFSDGDVLAHEAAVLHLSRALLEAPALAAAHPRFEPLRPARSTPLAYALHVYNARRGFERAPPAWIPGRFFALRAFDAPEPAQVAAQVRALGLRDDGFYRYDLGLVVDDVYLSRAVRAAHGPGSIAHVPAALVWHGAPETLRGMYRYYRRLRWELERCDALFPALRAARTARETNRARRAAAPAHERAALALFDAALAGCALTYRAERALRQRAPRALRFEPWPAVREGKAGPLLRAAQATEPRDA